MEEFFSLCRKLPIALYLGCSTLHAGRPSSAPLQVCPHSLLPSKNIPRSHFPPETQVGPSYSQSHPKALRPDGVHWNGCNGCSVYTTYPPGFLPGRRVILLYSSTLRYLLFRVWEPESERGACRNYEPEADWRGPTTPVARAVQGSRGWRAFRWRQRERREYDPGGAGSAPR
ncbi:hypothetical protein B0H14DRAFT_1500730 [Mycena olivaceomarginata]|nr:hypothetical protein B0H14DRAFT_1500730 [Mycena olivaceomarginata]